MSIDECLFPPSSSRVDACCCARVSSDRQGLGRVPDINSTPRVSVGHGASRLLQVAPRPTDSLRPAIETPAAPGQNLSMEMTTTPFSGLLRIGFKYLEASFGALRQTPTRPRAHSLDMENPMVAWRRMLISSSRSWARAHLACCFCGLLRYSDKMTAFTCLVPTRFPYLVTTRCISDISASSYPPSPVDSSISSRAASSLPRTLLLCLLPELPFCVAVVRRAPLSSSLSIVDHDEKVKRGRPAVWTRPFHVDLTVSTCTSPTAVLGCGLGGGGCGRRTQYPVVMPVCLPTLAMGQGSGLYLYRGGQVAR